MKHVAKITTGLLGIALLQACDANERPTGLDAERLDSGAALAADSAAGAATLLEIVRIAGDVDPQIPLFATRVGEPDNGSSPGRHENGRRLVNWDGVPAPFLNNEAFPADFFNVNATRGLVYVGPSAAALRVSDNDFADVNPTYGTDFEPFSFPKMFSPIGSNVAEIEFRIPGTNRPAQVASFGAVIDDVDLRDVTRVICYDRNGKVVANIGSPVRRAPDEYSLVGVRFSQPVIAKVVIVMGNSPIGAGIDDISSGGTKDVVVLDDLIYSEPQPIR